MTSTGYLKEHERHARSPVLHDARPGFCRRCGGPIIVPKGKLRKAALRNWKRINTDRIPRGWKLYVRASWHPWCYDYSNVLWQPSAVGLGVFVCACCGTDFASLEKVWRVSVPWLGLLHEHYRTYRGQKAKLYRVVVEAGYDPSRSLVEVDHIVPLWAGGRHDRSNLQVLCQVCHTEKTKREARDRADAKQRRAAA